MLTKVSDYVLSLLRTAVPYFWGLFVTWVITTFTWLPEGFIEWLQSAQVLAGVSAFVGILWYAFWRWLEPKLSPIVTRLVLGSNKAPTYSLDR